MSSGGLFQVLINLVFLAGFVAIWIRLLKPAKDDPRLSRGLQLLQSKIAILEDLSDQVEKQVQQVTQLIEAKHQDLQSYISQADDQIRKIESGKETAIESLDDLSDRKSTAKYVKAAQMAHQGATVEEIISEVDISRAEVEFVIKVNRHQLQFSLEHLPEWAKQDVAPPAAAPTSAQLSQQPVLRVKDAAISPLATQSAPAVAQTPAAEAPQTQAKTSVTPSSRANSGAGVQVKNDASVVKKVIFPRVDINRNLG